MKPSTSPNMTMRETPEEDPQGWQQEGRDLMRGVAGGAIFGMPLLYTMEMWWHGLLLSEWHLLLLLGLILVVNFFFCLFSGFRDEYSLSEALSESVTSVGIGVVLSSVILALIGELTPDLSQTESLGKVLMEAVAVSIGVSFANSQVREKTDPEEDAQKGKDKNGKDDPEQLQRRADLRDIGACLAGSVLLAFSVAPTEEINMIAWRLSSWQLLILLGAEILLCYIILFASGWEDREVYVKDSIFQKPWAETFMSCGLSLLVAGGLYALIGFDREIGQAPSVIAATVTLGLPAIVGGAAGRVLT